MLALNLLFYVSFFLNPFKAQIGKFHFVLAGGLLLASAIAYSVWPRWLRKKLLSHLQEHGYLVCMSCGYPLSGLDESRRCPECAQPFVPDDLIAAWKYWAVHRRLP